MFKNAKIEKSDLTLSTFVQHFLILGQVRGHHLTKKETTKIFVMGVKPDSFREEIYSRSCETLQEAMDESKDKLSTYRDILEINDRVKMADVKKEKRDPPFYDAVVNKVADAKALEGRIWHMRKSQENWLMRMI